MAFINGGINGGRKQMISPLLVKKNGRLVFMAQSLRGVGCSAARVWIAGSRGVPACVGLDPRLGQGVGRAAAR